jgi:hypothetical protein
MQEIIALITQKTGISEQQAQTAVDTVVGYLKQKLPGPLASQLDSVVAGGGPNLSDLAGGLGGLFGKK